MKLGIVTLVATALLIGGILIIAAQLAPGAIAPMF